MAQMNSSNSKFARILASITGMGLLTAFWTVGALMVCGIVLQGPLLIAFASCVVFALVVMWFGYPIALYYCFGKGSSRAVIVLLLSLVVFVVFAIEVFNHYVHIQIAQSYITGSMELILIGTVFFVGAFALKIGEKKAHIPPRANVLLTTLALFTFPIFAAYIHNRFRQAISSGAQNQ